MIKVKRQRLGMVASFEHLGATVSDEGSKLERFSQGLAARANFGLEILAPAWTDFNKSLGGTDALSYHVHVFVCLWLVGLNASYRREYGPLRWAQNLSCKNHAINEDVRRKIKAISLKDNDIPISIFV